MIIFGSKVNHQGAPGINTYLLGCNFYFLNSFWTDDELLDFPNASFENNLRQILKAYGAYYNISWDPPSDVHKRIQWQPWNLTFRKEKTILCQVSNWYQTKSRAWLLKTFEPRFQVELPSSHFASRTNLLIGIPGNQFLPYTLELSQ